MGFASINELLQQTKEKNTSICRLMMAHEAELEGVSEDAVFAQMLENWQIMQKSIERGIKEAPVSKSGLVGGDGQRLYHLSIGRSLCGLVMNEALSYALATAEVNASMGRIVACPTAGSCGIVPAVLESVQQSLDLTDEEVTMGLFTSAAIGSVVAFKASVSGAVGGCQAECGTASAMAAAAAVELAGGSPEAAINAAAMVIKNVLGLVCDPVAGLVEVPCVKRNAMGASLALVCADMALAGITSRIPMDDVIMAMDMVAHALPVSLKETALGGLAATPSGQEIEKRVHS